MCYQHWLFQNEHNKTIWKVCCRAAWINDSKHKERLLYAVLVVFAEGRVTADAFAGKLVDHLCSEQLKVEGLFKLSRQISVEPDPQGDLAVGRHNPTKRSQAVWKKKTTQLKSTAKSQFTKQAACGLHPSCCLPPTSAAVSAPALLGC